LTSSLFNQRTREFAVRAAIGAPPSALRWLILKWSVLVLVAGTIAGGVIFYFLSRLLVSFLFGVSRSDVATVLVATAAVTATVLAASAIPAYRAGRVDLVKALRHESST